MKKPIKLEAFLTSSVMTNTMARVLNDGHPAPLTVEFTDNYGNAAIYTFVETNIEKISEGINDITYDYIPIKDCKGLNFPVRLVISSSEGVAADGIMRGIKFK